MNILTFILDLIFPSKCLGCQKIGSFICGACVETILYSRQNTDENYISILEYRQPIIRNAIHLLKYKGKRPVGKILASLAYDTLLEELSEIQMMENFTDPVLIPIPISKSKYNERGYNQTEIIAKELTQIDKNQSFIYDPKILFKIKDTKSQAKMKDKIHRLRNLKGCFVVKHPEKIENKNIILLDDITTTGATFHEASTTLLKSGAKRVLCVAVAH